MVRSSNRSCVSFGTHSVKGANSGAIRMRSRSRRTPWDRFRAEFRASAGYPQPPLMLPTGMV
jgi:hypothetical protein